MKTFKDLKIGDKLFFISEYGQINIIEITEIKPHLYISEAVQFFGNPIIGNNTVFGTMDINQSKNGFGLFANQEEFLEHLKEICNETRNDIIDIKE